MLADDVIQIFINKIHEIYRQHIIHDNNEELNVHLTNILRSFEHSVGHEPSIVGCSQGALNVVRESREIEDTLLDEILKTLKERNNDYPDVKTENQLHQLHLELYLKNRTEKQKEEDNAALEHIKIHQEEYEKDTKIEWKNEKNEAEKILTKQKYYQNISRLIKANGTIVKWNG